MKRIILVIGLAGLFLIKTTKGYADNIEVVLDSADGTSAFVVQDSDNIQVLGISSDGEITLTDTAATVDPWIGLGASAGRIEFDNQTTDEINFLDCNVGIGTVSPARLLHVNGAMRLTAESTPSNPALGDIYVNSTDNNLYFYNGTSWIVLDDDIPEAGDFGNAADLDANGDILPAVVTTTEIADGTITDSDISPSADTRI